MAKGSVYH